MKQASRIFTCDRSWTEKEMAVGFRDSMNFGTGGIGSKARKVKVTVIIKYLEDVDWDYNKLVNP